MTAPTCRALVSGKAPALWLGVSAGLACQLGAVASLVRDVYARSQVGGLLESMLVLHVAGCVLVAGGLSGALPRDGRRLRALVVFLPALLFGSVLGTMGWLATLAATAHARPRQAGDRPTRGPGEPALPLRTDLSPHRGVGRGSLFGRLRFARDPSVRLGAVMAARWIPGPGVVPLLKLALRDPAEDVRLLGYALLERRQGAIYHRIQDGLRALERGPARPAVHLELAQQYWELVYQGLVEGDLVAYLLARARLHLTRAVDAEPRNGSLQLLMGRIQLRQRDLVDAATSLRQARAFGLPARVVNPHAAELAFAAGRFPEARRLLQAIGPKRPRGPVLSRLVEYWR